MENLFDVVEVNSDTCTVISVVAEGKTKRNADAIEDMAVMRRGCEDSFFSTVPAGSMKPGAKYEAGE